MRNRPTHSSTFHLRPLVGVSLGLFFLAGCGPISFTDNTALVVVGDSEPEPEPEPEPKAKLVDDHVEITEQVQFEFNKARIRSVSHDLLNDVVTVLKDNPQVLEVSVEGHTDNVGPDAYNKQLSRDRAKAVMKYLVDHGIDKGRLKTEGWGESKPIADNDSDSGRQENRRVEFLVTKQEPKPAPDAAADAEPATTPATDEAKAE